MAVGIFDRGSCVFRRPVRHRQDRNERLAVRLALDGEHDDARPILAAFVLAAPRFVIPQVGTRNNQARLGGRNRHPPSLLLVKQAVEVIVARVHARRGDLLDFFVRKLGGAKAPAHRP